MISIIIPVYQAEKKIRKCLDSVLAQKYQNWEAIIIDDGSDDLSGAICDEYAYRDNRFKVFHISNHGVSYARNYGLENAKGEYIEFLDSDDELTPNAMYRMFSIMQNEGADLVVCGYNMYRNNELICSKSVSGIYRDKESWQKFFYTLYENQFFNPPWNKLFRKELIKNNYNEKYSLGEDVLFNLQYLLNTSSIVFISDILYKYSTGSGDGLTTKYNRNNLECILEKYVLLIDSFCNANKQNEFEHYISKMKGDIKYYLRLMGIASLKRNIKLDIELNYAKLTIAKFSKLKKYIHQDNYLHFIFNKEDWRIKIVIKANSLPYWLFYNMKRMRAKL